MTTYPPPNDFVPADLDGSDWGQIEPLYKALIERELKCAGCLSQLLIDRSELDAAASEAQANIYIRMTCHTDDEAANKAYLDYVENVEPKLKEVSFQLDRRIVQCPFVDDLDQDRYGVYLRNLDADVTLFREENIPLQTEDSKLGQQYDEINGAMMVDFQGEERTMPQMARFVQVTDRSVRESAWSAIVQRRYVDHERIDDLFDQMVKLRHEVAFNAGHENFMEYAFASMHRFDYTPADCQQFHQAAREICVPVYHTLNAERTSALGVDSLRPWDLDVDVQGRDPLRPFENADEMVERTSAMFHRMDGSLGTMFDSLRSGDCLDLESRKGKAPGGYQYDRDRRRVPFIFMNAAGLQRDLETMVHEAGHAFHAMLSRDEPLVAYRTHFLPIEFAEVASMSMELLAHPYLDEFYDSDAANRARRTHLEGIVRTLSWIATIDAFQHWIYTHPDHTREQRDIYWLELDAMYGPNVDWSGFEGQRAKQWHRQLHLFNVPFYYIEYGIAQLGALQMWMQYRDDPAKAIENYRKAMTLGGSRPLPELFAAADLTFDFGPQEMGRLIGEVRTELDALPA